MRLSAMSTAVLSTALLGPIAARAHAQETYHDAHPFTWTIDSGDTWVDALLEYKNKARVRTRTCKAKCKVHSSFTTTLPPTTIPWEQTGTAEQYAGDLDLCGIDPAVGSHAKADSTLVIDSLTTTEITGSVVMDGSATASTTVAGSDCTSNRRKKSAVARPVSHCAAKFTWRGPSHVNGGVVVAGDLDSASTDSYRKGTRDITRDPVVVRVTDGVTGQTSVWPLSSIRLVMGPGTGYTRWLVNPNFPTCLSSVSSGPVGSPTATAGTAQQKGVGGPGTSQMLGGGSDACSTATDIFGPGLFPGDTVGATTDGSTACAMAGADVWYNWTATETGCVVVSFCGANGGSANFDTVLSVYDGAACIGALVACNDDSCGVQSEVTFPAVAGNVYKIQVGGLSAAMGSYVMSIATTAPRTLRNTAENMTFEYVIDSPAIPANERGTLRIAVENSVVTESTQTGVFGFLPGVPPVNAPKDFEFRLEGVPYTYSIPVSDNPPPPGHLVELTLDTGAHATQLPSGNAFPECTLITDIGTGFDSADISAPPSGDSDLGFNVKLNTMHVAIPLEVPAGDSVALDAMLVPLFQRDAPTAIATIDAAYVRLWSGDPMLGGVLIGGDLVTNRLELDDAGNFDVDGDIDVYRVLQSAPTDADRRIQEAMVGLDDLPLLSPGLYYLEMAFEGLTTLADPEIVPCAWNDAGAPGLVFDVAMGQWAVAADSQSNRVLHFPVTVFAGAPPLMVQACIPGEGGVLNCPCGNPPVSPGLGCNNFGAGPSESGTLNAEGVASLASDTVSLLATGCNNTSLNVFFTGSGTLSSGVPNGAGIRCVTTALKRLYTGSASGGAIIRPGMGDQTVSARSAALGVPISAGQTRHYFNIYRDPAAAGPCGNPASTVNTTNAGSITWNP